MSRFTSSRQLPDEDEGKNTDKATTADGLPPDGTPEGTPEDGPVDGQDDAASGEAGTAAADDAAAAGEAAPDGGDSASEDAAAPAETPAGDDEGDAVAEEDAAADAGPVADSSVDDASAGSASAGDASVGDVSAGDAPAEDADGAAPDDAVAGGGGWRGRYPVAAQVAVHTTTVLAGALVLFALLLPNKLGRLTPYAFARLPLEGIAGAALLIVLPRRARRVVAVLMGVGLGLLAILKCLDMGFHETLVRPFDLVLDWPLLGDGLDFLKESAGQAAAIGAVIGVALLVLALLVLMPLAVVRLSNLVTRHTVRATRTTLILVTVWAVSATLGVRFDTAPVAAKSNIDLVHKRAHQVKAGLRDERAFARKAAVDAFRDTPPDQLLTGLRGKDVLFTFIESYGRSAVEDPEMAPQVDAVLADGTKRLRKAGFSSRSGWLTSPVAGAGSWLAHSTFLSGLWIKNQQRYRNLTSSDRLTLTRAFKRTKAWRTVGIVPGVRRAWPEGKFFGLDNIYDSEHLGYKGPYFSWTPVPDQFSLAAFERLEHGKRDRKPLMSEIILASSHNPWAPIASMVDWDDVGDGSIYNAIKKEGKDPKEVWKDPHKVRTEYGRAIQYSLNSLISYVEKYGDENTVLVFLGDHQPVPTVTGDNTSRDVPVTIVAHDKSVLDRVSDWNWDEGLKPGKQAPVWRMDTFRDRFLTAYGSEPGSGR